MTNYARMYRFGITPWERYATAAAASITALLDREETERSRPLGRALDLGCGRGQYTPELARRGWEAVGIDYVPAAIDAAAAKSRGTAGLSYVVGDVTQLPSAGPEDVRLLPRHRLLPGPGRRTAGVAGDRCLCAGQPRGHRADAELRSEPVAAAGRRRIARGGPDRLRGLGDARGRDGGHRGPGLADEQDRAAVVQAAPTHLTGA
jgi:SAM-dependent methyltransferase